ncbi:MAG TPA: EAL domain-containing protein [Longimicrobiales bacterium]|nr:EAL domain-containing protein [Longimicrobiales bacterium]
MDMDAIRVLIADADQRRAKTLRKLLTEEGDAAFDVVSTARLDDAIAALRKEPFDAVLADLTLRDSAGLPTLALLLTYAGGAPVVVLSERADDPVPLRALQQGAHDQLPRDQLYATPVVRSIRYAVERNRTELALRESEQRYRTLFQQSRDAVYLADGAHRLVELNRAAMDLFGYSADELVGRDVRQLFADPADYETLERQLSETGSVRELEVRMRTRVGRELWCLLAATAGAGESGGSGGSQGIIHDVTERKQAELRLEHDALHDRLTGLPNRALFMDRLVQAVRLWSRQPEPSFVLLFLDLDRFKGVNDTLGHDAGDQVLRRTAGLLRSCVRASDTVARLGGDEFVVLLEAIESVAGAIQIAERMLRLLDRPYRLSGREFYTTASVGISWPTERAGSAEDLIREADQAMYRAKSHGGGRYVLFDPAMHRAAVSRLEVESDLRQGLAREEFVLLYQPILSMTTGRTTGFEALVRWNHPRRGTLLPDEFIPLAEETGLIVPLGLWVLREAARQLRRWLDAGQARSDIVMSANLSPRQLLDPAVVEAVATILDEERVRPDRIMLEVTETALMQDPKEAAARLDALRDLGIRLCLDDFGTGYASLAHLRRFPLDTLKVDRSFVGRLDRSPRDLQLVATITALARHLGIHCIVEGVETPGQLHRIRGLRPSEVQGFLFARPLQAEAAAAFIRMKRADVQPLRRFALRSLVERLRVRT